MSCNRQQFIKCRFKDLSDELEDKEISEVSMIPRLRKTWLRKNRVLSASQQEVWKD